MGRRLNGARRGLTAGLALTAILLSYPAAAQISPGPLSRPHARLEGSAHCLDCHRSGRGVDPVLCLTCHTSLRERIQASEGLHAGAAFRNCAHCHIEHHGEDYELVWWGKKGRESFDHGATGYPLRGAHARLACRDCHELTHIAHSAALKTEGVDLDRTYLGLSTACASCHADPHKDQFAGSPCASCHVESAWKPAAKFDHAQADFTLTGSHGSVACQKCHQAEKSTDGGEVTRYRGTPQACAACHADPHRGKLGANCSTCHQTANWKRIDGSRFDHGRTRFPLRGRHAAVACAECHGPAATSMSIPGFERCSTCHEDRHGGQFDVAGTAPDCARCHDERGFKPSTFSLADHQRTGYPLEGAHRTVTCAKCHREVSTVTLASQGIDLRFSGPTPTTVRQFDFQTTACSDCHADPHAAGTSRLAASDGCTGCHDVQAWKAVTFDHDRTTFALDGAHRRTACTDCHRTTRPTGGVREIPFTGAPTNCDGCHHDPHEEQFTMDRESSLCTRCHTTIDWNPSRFDHDRDAAFKLEGAHRAVACVDCHPAERRGDEVVIRYKPVPQACAACHAGIVRR
jgi:hypothetical protein